MKTSDLISALQEAPRNELIFANANGHTVHPGYHLTELKAASFDTVDCGGQVNQWQETVVQLWVPANADDSYMTCAQFLKIFDKVRRMIALRFDAEIRVEYGDENFAPSIYHVRSVTHNAGSTRVLIELPGTTCKARNRAQAASSTGEAQACCA